MTGKLARCIVTAALISLSCVEFTAQAGGTGGSLTYSQAQGWFWYSLPPVPPTAKKPKEKPASPPVGVTQAPKHRTLPTPAAKEPGPAFGSVLWIRANLPKYLNYAIDHPTRKNVMAYMYLQRLMMDKSERFSDEVSAVVRTTPFLDANTRRPISGMGVNLADSHAARGRQSVMQDLSKRVGIWFFYSSPKTCWSCSSQAAVLAGIHEIYGIPIIAISLDGSAPPTPFTQEHPDNGQSNKLGITRPMAVYLADPATREVIPISEGVLSRPSVITRVIQAAHTAGWITGKAYQGTLPMRTNHMLDKMIEVNASQEPTHVPVSPEQVLRRFHATANIKAVKE